MKQMSETIEVDVNPSDTVLIKAEASSMVGDIGKLLLRLTTGGLLAGHGSQKLLGWFGGNGLKGTAGWLESMGMKPGNQWAIGASASEFGGGMLTALGLLHPLGPIGTMAAMAMATGKVHWGKPIWVTTGGAELPVTNMAVALALALDEPGRFSLDRLLGIRLPRTLVVAVALAEAAIVVYGLTNKPQPVPAPVEDTAGSHLQAEHSGSTPA
jgi:putative oxidoreductase